MGLFSVRGRLPQPAGRKSPIRLHATEGLAQLAIRVRPLPARFGHIARAALQGTGSALAAKLRVARRVAVAATNDARIVAVLLLLAALALGLEMAASFHVI